MLLLGALIVVGVYVLLLAALWSQQERIVFQPPTVLFAVREPSASGETVRRVPYRSRDGTELFAFLVGDVSSSSGFLLAFHGNADLARNLVPWAAEVSRRMHTAVLLAELRGYDRLPGRPTYAGAAEDARAAWSVAHDSLGIASERMTFFGHSLGSAIATELAAEHQPRALVLQSPLSSARAMAARMFLPGLTVFWPIVSRVRYDTVERVRALHTPVWIAHGDRDLIIPSRMGREVYEAAAMRGELLMVRGAGHNDVAEVGGDAYWRWLARALGA